MMNTLLRFAVALLAAAILGCQSTPPARTSTNAPPIDAPAATPSLLPFASEEGLRRLVSADAKRGFAALANQYEAQINGVFCGPTTAAIVLNAVHTRRPDLPRGHARLRDGDLKNLPPGADLIVPRYTQDNVIAKGAKTRAQVLGGPMLINEKTQPDFGYQLRQFDEMLHTFGHWCSYNASSVKPSQQSFAKRLLKWRYCMINRWRSNAPSHAFLRRRGRCDLLHSMTPELPQISPTAITPAADRSMPRREEFLEAALTRFSKYGFASTSTRDICEDVGLARSGIYNYFESKETILLALEQREMVPMQQRAEAILAEMSGSPPFARLEALLKYTVLMAIRRREGWSLFQDMLRHLNDENRTIFISHRDRYQSLIEREFMSVVKAGDLPAQDIRLATYHFFGIADGIARWYRPDGRLKEEAVAAHAVGFFFHGVQAPATRPLSPEHEVFRSGLVNSQR